MGYLDGKRRDGEFGQPDLVLANSRDLVIIEMKVRGNEGAQQKYDAGQLLKYANLARYAVDRLGFHQVCHLILVPRHGPTPFLHRKRWIKEHDPATGRIVVRIEGLAEAAQKPKWRRRLARSDTQAELSDMLERMPVVAGHYDQLRTPVAGPREAESWVRASRVQLEKLTRDSEPSGHGPGEDGLTA
jgi:hypothetical protein